MVRTKSTPFQLELIRQQKDKSRNERVNTLHQRIFTLAEQSEYEWKPEIRLAIAAKQAQRQEIHLIEDELDNQSSESEEETLTVSEEEPNTLSSANTYSNTRNYDFIVEVILGVVIGFCVNIFLLLIGSLLAHCCG
jgi:hypothetical protein